MTKWGIMATGGIAERFAKSLALTENACAYAVASRNTEKARQFAEKFNIKKAYGTYEELAADPDVQVIYVATPMSCHYENVKLCLENGKAVLCEKSITCTVAELTELINLARAKNLFLMEAMWVKFMPQFLQAMEWYKSGKIGNPVSISANFCRNVPYDPTSRLFRKDLGGGATLDLGVYPISFVTAFFGYDCKITPFVHRTEEVDTSISVVLNYDGNRLAALEAGFDFDLYCEATIMGDKGAIFFDSYFYHTENLLLASPDGEILETKNYPKNIDMDFTYEIAEVQRCLNLGLTESPGHTLEDTLGNMKIMEYIMNK